MPTLNVEYLAENGPSPAAELPSRITISDRQHGLTKFTLRGSTASSMGGPVTAVYYLPRHSKDIVLRAFLEANPGYVNEKEHSDFNRAVRSHGQSWVQAAHRVGTEYFGLEAIGGENRYEGQREKVCPMCGEAVLKRLPEHLAHDCEGAEAPD